jgi:3-hydroxymyristoyl/3-hydroxydecanoyl-(acyl carrier protein) dehydratase
MSLQPFALSRLFEPEHTPAREVAFGRAGKRSLDDLRHDVAGLATHIAARERGSWLLHTEDSYAACVGFLALAHSGCTALLLPNRQPDTLRRLAPECIGAVLDPYQPVAGLDGLDPFAQPAGPVRALFPLERDANVAELLTSGTTGDAARVVKRLSHLEDEVATLEARFGAALPADARIFATVSHQHIYGLLFRVLWPLAAGRAFCADTPLHAQELLPRMRETVACVLVATPVHLKRLAGSKALRDARGVCRAVFSSGGPLEADTAHAIGAALGSTPFEILGSTETGGVAVRQRGHGGGGELWRPLPGVRIAARRDAGQLQVTSAFVSCGEPGPDGMQCFSMGDRVKIRADGRFELLGRSDRTVKVGEKRLSLPDMERELTAHPDVEEAALFVAPRAGEPRVHAVVVPTQTGRTALDTAGRRAFGVQLGKHLARAWDRVLVPRAWRFVEALPRNAQGKLPISALRELFENRADTPGIQNEQRSAELIVRQLRVPTDLAGIEGHFEGDPLVPGVMQIGWALDAAAALLGEIPRVRRLDAIKFPTLLRPGTSVRLEVQLLDAGAKLRFTLSVDGEITATGRCVLAEPRDV